jgi:hypothetical protein
MIKETMIINPFAEICKKQGPTDPLSLIVFACRHQHQHNPFANICKKQVPTDLFQIKLFACCKHQHNGKTFKLNPVQKP